MVKCQRWIGLLELQHDKVILIMFLKGDFGIERQEAEG